MIGRQILVLVALALITAEAQPCAAENGKVSSLAQKLRELPADVLTDELREQFKDQTHRTLRARGDEVNRRDVADWRAIETRADWEKLRDERLARLRASLGHFPEPPTDLPVRITGTIEGDGYTIENLVYESRPDFWVTANLYSPAEPGEKMPGILIAHSHHRPKVQDELQDMGMTWARAGCVVLVIDQVGHGERADHPFQSKQDYKKDDPDYRWWRQDYYYRFETNVQLRLIGESLMGWMAWDLMRGVDLLLERPGVDPDKIILLGSVAGGGDPAAVTAALDPRIDAAVPFNFGGPQPETRYPLPEDANLHFNYLGGAYWEGTRNLHRKGVDGFLDWVIVGGIAPRPLIYAHEFAWDKERDPVWRRLNTIYGFYDASDRIGFAKGSGSVKGRPPESTHCTNIGRVHRKMIHPLFERWFDIRVSPDDEYSEPRDDSELRSMTEGARRELKPRTLHTTVTDLGNMQIRSARKRLANRSPRERRKQVQGEWRQLLGKIDPAEKSHVLMSEKKSLDEKISIERIAIETEPDIVVPMILLHSESNRDSALPTVVALSQSGKEAFLWERPDEIAKLVEGGAVVCLPDVRGVGKSRGSRGEGDGSSYYALLFETPMLGLRLRDLRAVLAYLRSREDLAGDKFALWGDSFKQPNPADTDFQVPKRVSGRPAFSEPLGGLLALLGALYEDDVTAIYVQGGLGAYADVLRQPYVYVPHDVVVPGVVTTGDLPEVVASLAPRRVCLDGLVDGLNRTLPADRVRQMYKPTLDAYRSASPDAFSIGEGGENVAEWLMATNRN